MSKNSGECLKSFEKCYLSTTKCFENTHFIQTQTHQYCYSIGVLLFHLQKSFFSITFSYFISPKYTDKFLWLNNLANKLFKYAAKHTTSIANTVDKLVLTICAVYKALKWCKGQNKQYAGEEIAFLR